MQLVFTVEEPSVAKATMVREYPVLNFDGPRIMVVEPVSWSFLAALFLAEFAKALGQGLGQGVADSILKALGLIKDQNGDLKQYFEQMAERIVREVRTIIYENEIRREHANLDACYQMFQEYLKSPETRLSDIPSLDARTTEVYEQLRSLGLSAFPGMVGAVGLRIALKVERFRISKVPSEAEIARNVIENSLKMLSSKVDAVNAAYQARVVGPLDTKEMIMCKGYPDPDSPRPSYEETFGPGVACRIDGELFGVALFDCHRDRPERRAEIEQRCNNARSLFANEFKNEYAIPFGTLRSQSEKLLSELKKEVEKK